MRDPARCDANGLFTNESEVFAALCTRVCVCVSLCICAPTNVTTAQAAVSFYAGFPYARRPEQHKPSGVGIEKHRCKMLATLEVFFFSLHSSYLKPKQQFLFILFPQSPQLLPPQLPKYVRPSRCACVCMLIEGWRTPSVGDRGRRRDLSIFVLNVLKPLAVS